MKKRIILTLTALIVFTFILALSISAADIITSNSDEFGTVNIVAGVNESTTIQDKKSRVVLLNADNTYSTFPAYYISDVELHWQGTVQYKFDALNTALGTENGHRTVQNTQGTLYLNGKVNVARSVDQVDLVSIPVIVPECSCSS